MKNPILTCVAAIAVTACTVHAQSLTISAPGYAPAAKLFDSTAGFTITGLAADLSGNVFYLESDANSADGLLNTVLYRRTKTDNYASSTLVYTYSAPVFGSFVTANAGKIYFGESSANTIRAVNPDGSSPSLIGTVIGNYDLAFSPAGAFVSANPEPPFDPPQNKVYQLNLTTGATTTLLDATPDYSGPVEFDALGNLLYGASGFNGPSGLYRYNYDPISPSPFGATPLTLDDSHRVLPNGTNGALALGSGGSLWQSNYSALNLIDLTAQTSTVIGIRGSSGDSIGQLDFAGGEVFVNVTKFSGSASVSSVYAVAPVPEPSSGALLTFGLAAFASRRRRH